MASKLHFIYFNLRARGEPARLVLAEAGVDYVDERIEYDPDFKIFYAWRSKNEDKVPLGKLPVLLDEGVIIPQSITIARYLAKKFGLSGKDDKEAALADAVVDEAQDLSNSSNAEKLKSHLSYLEKWLHKSNTGFFVSQLTYADLLVFYYVDEALLEHPQALEGFPLVKEHHQRIAARPNIAAWLKKRPVSKI